MPQARRPGPLDTLLASLDGRLSHLTETTGSSTGSLQVWTAATLGVVGIGFIDYISGTEVRVFPLYYLPVGIVAWYRGRLATMAIGALGGVAWLAANYLAGMQFGHVSVWIVNTTVQALSFAIVGLLISTLRGALLRERELSRTDPLTSLLNRRAFSEEAWRLLARCRRKKCPMTVAYVDLDDFKNVNDQHGHQAGDDLLRRVGRRLQAVVRPSDAVARLGGDEFAILLSEVSPDAAVAVVNRLRRQLVDELASEGLQVTASIGGATFLVVPEDIESMIQRADACLYAAKKMGKNRVHLEVVGEGGP